MSAPGRIVEPNPETASYHAAKFKIFRQMYREQLQRREAMRSFALQAG